MPMPRVRLRVAVVTTRSILRAAWRAWQAVGDVLADVAETIALAIIGRR